MYMCAAVQLQQQAAPGSVVLLPLCRLLCHLGPVTCMSGLTAWQGVLMSASTDQTVRSWQPDRETARGAATLLPACCSQTGSKPAPQPAAAAAVVASAAAPSGVNASGHVEFVADAAGAAEEERPVATATAAPATQFEVAGPGAAAAAGNTPQPAASAALPPAVELQPHPILPPPAAAGRPGATGSAAALSSSGMRHWKQFVPPGSRTFLPPLPDLANLAVQQQAQLDVVALAEALYPPTTRGPAAAGVSDPAALSMLMKQFRLRGLQGEQQHFPQARQQCQLSGISVSDAFHQRLSNVVSEHYLPGSWLPTMTADVPELLQQHQQAVCAVQQGQCGRSSSNSSSSSQQQQQQAAPDGSSSSSSNCSGGSHSSAYNAVSSLAVNQVAVMQYITGDVGGFLRSAVAADVVTPDVVALAAAGGAAAWAAAGRLAAAKLAAAGQLDAAAVLQLAIGDTAAAAGLARCACRDGSVTRCKGWC